MSVAKTSLMFFTKGFFISLLFFLVIFFGLGFAKVMDISIMMIVIIGFVILGIVPISLLSFWIYLKKVSVFNPLNLFISGFLNSLFVGTLFTIWTDGITGIDLAVALRFAFWQVVASFISGLICLLTGFVTFNKPKT
ncbi:MULTISPECIES: hypothetical protein [unclassified Moraxella]|uniref:hypothetical protein n=1 Tax=unclassified Moraxella TaxID=2685852 RepID=UPI003AF95CB2